MKIPIGTSGFGYKEWKGKFYPEKISPKEMLCFYAERFKTVEINNTFYHMPKESVLLSWAKQVPDDFIFAVKAPRVITHLKRLKHVDEEAEHLFQALAVLEGKLGPVLFQFPQSYHADLATLTYFLGLIPGKVSCAFEFRSPAPPAGEILDLLRERGCSLCVADTDENPAKEIISGATWGYLRLRRSNYTDADLARWLEQIRAQQWKQAFVFFKHEEEAKGPKAAMRLQELAD